MSLLAAMFFASAATALAGRPAHGARRLRQVSRASGPPEDRHPDRGAVLVLAAAAALALGIVVGAWAGVAAGVGVTFLGRRDRTAREPLDVPLLADLVAACLAAGATMPDALRAAGDACPAAGALCRRVADRLAAGTSPPDAWADWLTDPDLAPMARACVRAAGSGAATTEELRRAGERVRTRRRAELAARAHRAGVWAVLPLGLCFLPAFALVGIAPFALGLLGR